MPAASVLELQALPIAVAPAAHTPVSATSLAGESGAGLGDDHPLVRRLAAPGEGERLLASFLAGVAASTAPIYQQRLAAFAAHVGVPPASLAALLIARGPAATTLALREFAAALRQKVVVTKKGAARTLAPATRNGYLDAVRSFVRFLNTTHFIAWRVHVELDPLTAYRDTVNSTGDQTDAVKARPPSPGGRPRATCWHAIRGARRPRSTAT
jgi:hypothetical protein